MKPKILNDGILPIYKPTDLISINVTKLLKKLYSFDKIGHLGTLDPIAEGILPIIINKGTKLVSYLENYPKYYRATLKMGIQTDTDDITGSVIFEKDVPKISKKQILEVLETFKGEINQVPPKYSAVKINGERAYKLAREGEEFTIEEKQITIYNIELIEVNLPEIVIDVHCSTGTYIRSLIRDIGIALNNYATMTSLIRIMTSNISIGQAIAYSDIEKTEDITKFIIPVEKLLIYPTMQLTDFEYTLVKNGQIPTKFKLPKKGTYQLLHSQKLVAIVSYDGEKITLEKMI